jgi:hypothetical protein
MAETYLLLLKIFVVLATAGSLLIWATRRVPCC